MSTISSAHLRPLATFATVVECGSFAKAARMLNSSRSRVSEQITKLEEDLGVRLLQRSTRQLSITLEGQQVYEQARQLAPVIQGVESILNPAQPSGRVAITMTHDIAHKFLLPILDDFKNAYPKVELDLVLDDARVDMIAEQIDLAIRIGIPRDESLVARVMHEEKFSLFASRTFAEQHGPFKTVSQLEKLPWVVLNQASHNAILHLQQRGKSIVVRPQHYTGCNSPLMVQQMVLAGLGVGALLPGTVKAELASGNLVQVLPSVTSESVVFSLVYPSRRQVPARTRALIDFILGAKVFG